MASNEITTILGKGSSFDGKLTFEGAVRIDGGFSGEIETKGTLMIGETAEVQAKIHASNIIIEGLIRGEIVATNSLEIHDSARVYGNLLCPSLMIQKGAIFEGNCRMDGSSNAGASTEGRRPEPVIALAENES
ncbi:MAG: polymer-forming cytoskeletal protein [Myxococcales bacterium]|nr:polymer-forming cytoskeletal protein [Myxococcales bacterium]